MAKYLLMRFTKDAAEPVFLLVTDNDETFWSTSYFDCSLFTKSEAKELERQLNGVGKEREYRYAVGMIYWMEVQ
jgi:hypothetical protein